MTRPEKWLIGSIILFFVTFLSSGLGMLNDIVSVFGLPDAQAEVAKRIFFDITISCGTLWVVLLIWLILNRVQKSIGHLLSLRRLVTRYRLRNRGTWDASPKKVDLLRSYLEVDRRRLLILEKNHAPHAGTTDYIEITVNVGTQHFLSPGLEFAVYRRPALAPFARVRVLDHGELQPADAPYCRSEFRSSTLFIPSVNDWEMTAAEVDSARFSIDVVEPDHGDIDRDVNWLLATIEQKLRGLPEKA